MSKPPSGNGKTVVASDSPRKIRMLEFLSEHQDTMERGLCFEISYFRGDTF